jgi:hypothetical protein
MPASEQFRKQAALLVRAIPLVAAETCFALKGGTAIDLFVRDMPRLSVDIDLTYLPVGDRATSLANIDAAMQRLEKRIRESLRGARVISVRLKPENIVSKIFEEADGVQAMPASSSRRSTASIRATCSMFATCSRMRVSVKA